MERAAAVKKLTALLGKNLGYRINEKSPSQEEREQAKASLPAATADRNTLRQQQTDRQRILLEGDEEYQRITVAARAASAAVEKLSGMTRHFKITVGVSSGMFFVVKAEEDSWEEVIKKLITSKKE